MILLAFYYTMISNATLCIVIIIILILVILYNSLEYYIHNVYHPCMDHIIDNIYLGNWVDSTNWKVLEARNIKSIFTLNVEKYDTKCRKKNMEARGIAHLFICIDDRPDENIKHHLDTGVKYIHGAGPILVHCSAGISRSASFVIAYLIRYKNMSVNEALAFCRSRRRRVNPNIGFIKQLREYEVKYKGVPI